MNASRQGLGTFATMLESARQTVALSLRDRLWWIVAAAMVVLPMLAYALSGRAHERIDGRDLFCLLCWWLHGTVVVPWLTLYLGVQAVHGRIEDRTFQYLFLRPVHRAALLLGNWLAVSLMAAVATVGGMVLLFVAVAARPELWSDGVEWGLVPAFAGAFVVAALAYAAAAMFFAACFRRPLVWAAFFVVGLQTLAANLPVSAGLRSMTITDPVRRLLLDRIEPDRQLAAMLWPAERDFRLELIGQPLRELAVFVLTMLVAAVWCYTRREFDSRERE
jgi:ABC-type transport system involved in multi-copper enzyme maturation permease subunit